MPNPLKLMMAAAGAGASGYSRWAWGNGGDGQLGDGTVVSKSSVVAVGAGEKIWLSIDGGGNGYTSIRSDDTSWSWGVNTGGKLGDGTTITKSSPVAVLGGLTFSKVSMGAFNSYRVGTDGKLYSCGAGLNGANGQGSTVDYSVPTAVGALTTWETAQGGAYRCYATKTDGTLWVFGDNSGVHDGGLLGVGDINDRSSPVQVGSLTDWGPPLQIACANSGQRTLIIKADNTMWGMGQTIGNGTSTSYSSPVQISGSWISCCTWDAGGSGGIKTDGTLWSWGNSGDGQNGRSVVHSGELAPIQVGSLTDWAWVTAGSAHVAALKTDGTAWSWGKNYYGQVGDGTVVNRSSPVLVVGGYTDWIASSLAMSTDGAQVLR